MEKVDSGVSTAYDWLLDAGFDPSKIYGYGYWRDLLRKLPNSIDSDFRINYIQECGFPILTIETIDLLASALQGKKVIDVGCGVAFLTHQLRQRGVVVSPVDDGQSRYVCNMVVGKHCEILHVDVKDVDLAEYDVVLMSWPDQDRDTASTVARKMHKGQYLIYQGEGEYGCTADPEFFTVLTNQFKEYNVAYQRLNEMHIGFYRMFDRWRVFKKAS